MDHDLQTATEPGRPCAVDVRPLAAVDAGGDR